MWDTERKVKLARDYSVFVTNPDHTEEDVTGYVDSLTEEEAKLVLKRIATTFRRPKIPGSKQ